MEKEEFENYCKGIINKNSRDYIIVKLRNATFYMDNYFINELYDKNEVNFIWKKTVIGHCKIKSIIKVF